MKTATIYHVKHKPVDRIIRKHIMPTQFTTTIQDTSDGITPIHRYRIYADIGVVDDDYPCNWPRNDNNVNCYQLFVVINGERHDINETLEGLTAWYLDWIRYQLYL